MTPAGRQQLKVDEGTVLHVYDDATGKPILRGPGGGNPTIGIGRNLAGRGISEDEAEYLFDNDIRATEAKLTANLPWFASAPPVWQDVLVMTDFNTGNVMAWHDTLGAMAAGDADTAAAELLASRAADQLPARYKRMAAAIRVQAWG